MSTDIDVSDVAKALNNHRDAYSKVFGTEFYLNEFDFQQKLSRSIRECAMQLYEDAANISSGALNVCNLTITLDIVSGGQINVPTIDVDKEYFPRVTLERMAKK